MACFVEGKDPKWDLLLKKITEDAILPVTTSIVGQASAASQQEAINVVKERFFQAHMAAMCKAIMNGSGHVEREVLVEQRRIVDIGLTLKKHKGADSKARNHMAMVELKLVKSTRAGAKPTDAKVNRALTEAEEQVEEALKTRTDADVVSGMAVVFVLSSQPREGKLVEFRENPHKDKDKRRRFSAVVWLGMSARDV